MENRRYEILVVDDDEGTFESVKIFLEERQDLYFTWVKTGGEATVLVEQRDFDLVLLDLKLPLGTEGFDVLTRIKRIKPSLGIIMISGHGDIPRAVEAMKRGAKDFIEKGQSFGDVLRIRVAEHIVDLLENQKGSQTRSELIRTKYDEVLKSKDKQKKGKGLEVLLREIFNDVRGFETKTSILTATSELDLVVINRSQDPFWQKEKLFIIGECKNWVAPVDAKVFSRLFDNIAKTAGRCSLGFIITTGKFTKALRDSAIARSYSDTLIVLIDGKDLRGLVESSDRGRLLQEFVERDALKQISKPKKQE